VRSCSGVGRSRGRDVEIVRAGDHRLEQRLQPVAAVDERLVGRLVGGGVDILAVGADAIGVQLAGDAGGIFGIVVQVFSQPLAAHEGLALDGAGNVDQLAI